MYVLVYFLCFSYVTHHENIFYVVTRTTMLPSGLYYLFLRSIFLISAFSSELRLPEHIFCGDYLILTFLFICFYGGKKTRILYFFYFWSSWNKLSLFTTNRWPQLQYRFQNSHICPRSQGLRKVLGFIFRGGYIPFHKNRSQIIGHRTRIILQWT